MSNTDDDFKVDRDWSIDINLAGVQAPTGMSNVKLPQGFYRGTVSDMYINDNKPNRVVIKLAIADAPYQGVIRTSGLNLPKGDDDGVRFYWRGLAESCGYTPAQLDKGEVKLNLESFKGKMAHFKFVPKDESGSGYEDIGFFPEAIWSQQRQLSAGSEVVEGTPAGGSLGGDDGTTSKADVLKSLNLS